VPYADRVLWTLQDPNGHQVECVIRLAMGGVQVELISDGSPLISWAFRNAAEALAWAEEERARWDQGHTRPSPNRGGA
jgi:hypothetical protein